MCGAGDYCASTIVSVTIPKSDYIVSMNKKEQLNVKKNGMNVSVNGTTIRLARKSVSKSSYKRK